MCPTTHHVQRRQLYDSVCRDRLQLGLRQARQLWTAPMRAAVRTARVSGIGRSGSDTSWMGPHVGDDDDDDKSVLKGCHIDIPKTGATERLSSCFSVLVVVILNTLAVRDEDNPITSGRSAFHTLKCRLESNRAEDQTLTDGTLIVKAERITQHMSVVCENHLLEGSDKLHDPVRDEL